MGTRPAQYAIDDNSVGIGSDIIREFVETYTSPEHVQLFVRATIVLTSFGIDTVETDSEQIIMKAESNGSDIFNVLEQIEEVYKHALRSLLIEHSITVSNEISFTHLIDIVAALREVELNELSEEIVLLIDSHTDTITQLSEVLGLVGELPAHRYVSHLWDVGLDLIANIRKYHMSKIDFEELSEQSPEDITEYRNNLRRYIDFIKTDQIRLVKMVKRGLPLGLAIHTYIQLFKDEYNGLEDPNIAVELYGAVLISTSYKTEPLQVIDPFLESLVVNPGRTQRIRQIIRNISVKFANYKE